MSKYRAWVVIEEDERGDVVHYQYPLSMIYHDSLESAMVEVANTLDFIGNEGYAVEVREDIARLSAMPSPTGTICVGTDGACKGNPGPGAWAFIIQYADGEKRKGGGFYEHTTNQRMELEAVVHALEHMVGFDAQVEIITDSKYVHSGATEWRYKWIKNGWRTASKGEVKHVDLWKRMDRALKTMADVRFKWVPGHDGNALNEEADSLANDIIRDGGFKK